MTNITDIKRQNRDALKYILGIYDLRKQYASQLNNISALGAANSDGMPHGSGVSNPVENKTFALLDIELKKNWIITIELMEQTLSEKQRKYLEIRRDAEHQIREHTSDRRGRPLGWFDYTQAHYATWFYERYGGESVPPQRTMETWMKNIIDITVRIAIYKKCFE